MSATRAAYESLIEHAELELELAGRGEIDGLLALGGRWEQLVAALPPTPPRAAGALLERARLIHERTRVELLRLREGVLAEFSAAGAAKRAAGGYGAGTAPAGRRIDHSA